MQALSRNMIAAATGGQILMGADGPDFTQVFTDTRKPVEKGLFFALDGPNFNAHKFLSKAIEKGASGLVISNKDAIPASANDDLYVLLVENTRQALGLVGQTARLKQNAIAVAITGSVGKTTMKNMVAAALAPFGKVGRTPGNYNNDIGLPLTLCGMDGDEDFIVLELGMNAPGEIEALTKLAVPNVGLVTGAHPAHLEFFKNVDAIADAKSELYATLDPSAYAIANGDDSRIIKRARTLHPQKLTTYGLEEGATVRALSPKTSSKGVKTTITGPTFTQTLTIPALGVHHALHAAGALAVVDALGLDVQKAAESISLSYCGEPHRMSLLQSDDDVTILDDCYNASPLSMSAALKTFGELAEKASRRVAVLGSMLELGEQASSFHQETGRLVVESGIDELFAIGPFASDLAEGASQAGLRKVSTAEDVTDVVANIIDSTPSHSWLLLKGSRGGRLERVLDSYTLEETG